MKQVIGCGLAVALLLCGARRLPAEIITFDELPPPPPPVNGLSLKGVTFHFTVDGVPSTAALFGGTGPGTLMFVQEPALTGPAAGTLTLDFATPVTSLKFGVATTLFIPVNSAATVQLANGAQSAGVFTVNTAPLVSFSEGQFRYVGGPINHAVVTFKVEETGQQFAVDNIDFTSSVQSVPEPASLSLLGVGASLLYLFRRR